MEDSQISSNEILRLSALKELNLLDTPADQDFDDIITLGIQISGATIALISLMDSDRQWFKSKIGIDFCEVSRNDSFCKHIIQTESMILVEDALNDDRFKNNPFVIGEPYVRFYLGIPIKNQKGFILGTLCILDTKILKLSSRQINSLQILARQAQSLFNKKSELLHSEKILSTYVNNTLDSIILLDKDKNIIDSNKIFQKRVRDLLHKEYHQGANIFDYSHPSTHSLINEHFAKTILGEEIKTEMFIPFDSGDRWYKVLFFPIRDSFHEIIGVMISLTNITDQKNYEKQLQSLNNELNFHYTNSPLGVINWDSTLTIKSWSEQAEVIFGWKAFEIVGKSLSEINIIHESDVVKVSEYADDMLSGRVNRLTSKNRNLTKTGETIYCNWHNSILKDENGKVISILSLVENVTDVIKIARDLELKKSNYEALINSTDDCIWSIDTNYRLITMNNAFLKSLDFSLGTKYNIGDSVFKTPMPDALKEYWKDLYDRVFQGEHFTTDLQLPDLKPNGDEEIHFEIKANPISKNGIIVGAALLLRDVSEQRIAEQKLWESEANLQAIFNTTDTGYILINNHLDVVSFNKIASDISSQNFFNANKKAKIGTPILDYFPEERKPILQKMMLTVLEGKKIEYEINFPQPNGTTNWYYVRLYPIENKTNQNYGLVMALSDISNQKLSAIELNISKERFDLAVKGSSDGIWDWDIAHNITYLSHRFRDMLGYPHDEIYLNIPFLTFLKESSHNDDVDSVTSAINRHLEQRDIFHHEFRLKTTTDIYRWFLIRGQATWDEENRPSRMAGSLTDITERKLADKQLQQSEKMFSDLAKNSPGIVFQFCVEPDGSSYFTYLSDKGHEIFGTLINDKDWASKIKISHKERNAFFNSIAVAILNKKEWNYEGEIETRDGRKKWFQGLASPIIKEDKITYNGISFDITERKIAEEDRKNLRKLEISLAKEKEISNLKSRFISLTSHEFRTPITAIVTSADLLDFHTKQIVGDNVLKHKIKMHIDKIILQTSRLEGMLKDILIIGKTADGKLPVKPHPININKFLNDINSQYYTNRKDGRKLRMFLSEEYKEISTDPVLLSHIISNLVNNAFKYSANAQEPELHLKYYPSFFSITVKDYGIGIPPEDQEHLFETFFRANNVLNIEGTGLGLTITKEFTKKLGGDLNFSSNQSKGSTFILRLPYSL